MDDYSHENRNTNMGKSETKKGKENLEEKAETNNRQMENFRQIIRTENGIDK